MESLGLQSVEQSVSETRALQTVAGMVHFERDGYVDTEELRSACVSLDGVKSTTQSYETNLKNQR
jgi:hypothetical protein